MTNKSPFQQFVPQLWQLMRSRYPFSSRPDKSLCNAMPKSSSIHLGLSARNGKQILLHLQNGKKAWSAAEFCLNVHISQDFLPAKQWHGSASAFAAFADGYYRLSNCVEGRDRWWCLAPRGDRYLPRTDSQFVTYWQPPSYSSQQQAFDEAALAVCEYLDQHLFPLANLAPRS